VIHLKIITSNFFGYNGSYEICDTINPGKGYWVKVDQPGKLILSSIPSGVISSRIKINPTSEMPPLPPSDDNGTISKSLPEEYALYQAYPNPFNPSTTISYQLPMQSQVTLKIFDVLGREVATLVNGVEEPGYKSVNFDASGLPSGIYYYRLQAGNYVETKKLLLLR